MRSQTENALVFNTTAAKYSNLVMEIDVARRTGFDGVETTAAKVRRDYLTAGHSISDLKAALNGLSIPGIGTILDAERHGDDAQSLTSDARSIFELAHSVGAIGVQVITGPLDYREVMRFREGEPKVGYRGVLEYGGEQRIEVTAANLKMLAKIAQEFDLIVYLEAARMVARQLTGGPTDTLAESEPRQSQDRCRLLALLRFRRPP